MDISNLGMSEWLIACAVLLFAVVLIDGVRRMRAERKQDIKWDLQLNRDLEEESEADYSSNELVDAYRVVDRSGAGQETVRSHGTDLQDDSSMVTSGDLAERDQGQLFSDEEQRGVLESEPVSETGSLDDTAPISESGDEQYDADFAHENIQLIVLHVKSKQPQGFSGSDIIQVLVACNLRYGEKQILHRFADPSATQGPIEFSVANMVEPGTFDLDHLSDFTSPGVTFFMALPGAPDPIKSFNAMVETASYMAQTLGGEVLDEEHSSATQQVINHYRDRIRTLSVQFAET